MFVAHAAADIRAADNRSSRRTDTRTGRRAAARSCASSQSLAWRISASASACVSMRAERALALVALRGGGSVAVVVIPAVALDRDQAFALGLAPPVVAPPAAADQAGAIEDRARRGRDDHEARRVHRRAGFRREIAQDAGESALRAAGRVVEVVPVEPRAIVEAERDRVLDARCRRRAEQHVDDARQRHDAQAAAMEQAQVRGQRDVVVVGVIVAADVVRVVGEDGDAHRVGVDRPLGISVVRGR